MRGAPARGHQVARPPGVLGWPRVILAMSLCLVQIQTGE